MLYVLKMLYVYILKLRRKDKFMYLFLNEEVD